ncbi:MAG: winged helix-turn-helix transcriptional regulator, partial [Bacteroidales bacterium]|nr:winged helix-turn-helix transcriptional regulator [Bacteroidales bacterium]
AENQFVSQPTLTYQIKLLEEEIGFTVFERSGKGAALTHLEDDGIINREVFTEVPPRVEYRLSERGKSLMPHLDALILWGIENQESIINDRIKHIKSNN